MTQIFLGYPPEHIKNWIIDHSKPAAKNETHIKFTDGTEGDYLIEGAMDYAALMAAGLMSDGTDSAPCWLKNPLEVEIGFAVTSIEYSAFSYCNSLK